MLTQHTINRLSDMKLYGMIDAYERQTSNDITGLSFEDRFGMIVDIEWLTRQNRKLDRLLKNARLRVDACFEDIDYRTSRSLDKSFLTRLSTCSFIKEGRNILITGATGMGKTFIACAFGNAACRQGYTTRYYRISRLVEEIMVSKGEGKYLNFLSSLQKADLLILDDWGLNGFSISDTREIFEIIEDRSQDRATVIASQIPVDKWHDVLGEATLADAILDRLIHGSYRIDIKGPSMRRLRAEKQLNPASVLISKAENETQGGDN